MSSTTDLAIGTEIYSPNFNKDGEAYDYHMSTGKFNKNFPNGIICPCTNKKYLTRDSFKQHTDRVKHINWLEELEKEKQESSSELKTRLLCKIKESRERNETLKEENETLKEENETLNEENETLKEKCETNVEKHTDICLEYEEKLEDIKEKYDTLKQKYNELRKILKKNE